MSILDIGKTVAYVPATLNNVRSAEGCFIRLKDNSIIYGYSHYYTVNHDCGPSDIGFLRSYDEGETWPERGILFGDGSENLMDPWLLRMQNGDLGLVYIFHPGCCDDPYDDTYYHKGMAYFARSADEGKTWTKPMLITPENEGFCFICDHGIRLRSGRILLPMANHPYEKGCFGGLSLYGTACFFYSDDDGATWHEGPQRLYGPSRKWSMSGLQEPSPYQTESGRIRVFCRTDLGCHYETDSDDDGLTWTEPMPNKEFTGCCAPMVWRRTGQYTVAVLNPVPHFLGREYLMPNPGDDRNPLVLYISEDDGETFRNLKLIDDKAGSQYPSIFDGGDYILVGYQVYGDAVIKKIFHREFNRTLKLENGTVIV